MQKPVFKIYGTKYVSYFCQSAHLNVVNVLLTHEKTCKVRNHWKFEFIVWNITQAAVWPSIPDSMVRCLCVVVWKLSILEVNPLSYAHKQPTVFHPHPWFFIHSSAIEKHCRSPHPRTSGSLTCHVHRPSLWSFPHWPKWITITKFRELCITTTCTRHRLCPNFAMVAR